MFNVCHKYNKILLEDIEKNVYIGVYQILLKFNFVGYPLFVVTVLQAVRQIFNEVLVIKFHDFSINSLFI